MSHSVGPEPDPSVSLEALEQKLRALPQADVPARLPAKLLASIPASKAAGSFGAAAISRWLLIAAVSVACAALSVGAYLAVHGTTSKFAKPPNEKANPADSPSAKSAAAPSSQALDDLQKAVRVDPFNAEAWFALAKAQAAGQSSAAAESAQKAIDVARSRNNNVFAGQVETWLRSYRASQGKGPTK
jgi:cytochrome c-type biogenesis protein CcmH/NrfG